MNARFQDTVMDPEIANAIAAAKRKKEREAQDAEMRIAVARLAEHRRMKAAVEAAYRNGAEHAERGHYAQGVRWGAVVGFVAGALVVSVGFWLVMTTINALGLQL